MDPGMARAVAAINARHGTSYRLRGRLPGGETGAFAPVDETGARFVLKRYPRPGDAARLGTIARMLARLRSVGYPLPRYLVVGRDADGTYAVQDALPGAPPRGVTVARLPRVFGLNGLQRGRAEPEPPAWPARVVGDVLRGGDRHCLLDPMRSYSSTTARLFRVVQGMTAGAVKG